MMKTNTKRTMFNLKKMFFLTVPASILLVTVAMLLPCWWSSDTFLIGMWRARSSISSNWIWVEPPLDSSEGRLLFLLQILSVVSIIFVDFQGLFWFILLMQDRYSSISFSSLISLFIGTIVTHLCLSTIVFLVWQTSQNYLNLIRISFSFYIVVLVLILQVFTLISLFQHLIDHRRKQRSIQPREKIRHAFDDLFVA